MGILSCSYIMTSQTQRLILYAAYNYTGMVKDPILEKKLCSTFLIVPTYGYVIRGQLYM